MRRSGTVSGTYSTRRARGAGELANAVDRVVVVERQREAAARCEGIRLADELQCRRRVLREDDGVDVGRRVQELEDQAPRLLDERRGRNRAQAARMRVAEHAAGQQVGVLADLRLGVQTAAGVVEIDMPVAIEPAVVAFAQLVDRVGRCVLRISLDEPVERRVRAHLLYSTRPAVTVAAIVLATGYRSRSAGPREHPVSIRRIESGAQIWLAPVRTREAERNVTSSRDGF